MSLYGNEMKNISQYIFMIMTFAFGCTNPNDHSDRPDIIVSTDIGGSDPDDYQSLVHLLVYVDRFNIKGLISSPAHQGRKKHIEEVLHAYQEDYENLRKHSDYFRSPADLFAVTKQGAEDPQPTAVPTTFGEGAEWIIKKSKENGVLFTSWFGDL